MWVSEGRIELTLGRNREADISDCGLRVQGVRCDRCPDHRSMTEGGAEYRVERGLGTCWQRETVSSTGHRQ